MEIQQFGNNWTALKLEKLKQYINTYFKVMKNQSFKLIYIDAFSGSGDTITNKGENIGNSPSIAIEFNFDRYIFIDKNKKYIENLKENISKYNTTGKTIEYHIGDSNNILKEFVKKDMLPNERGIAFLDPYAMSVEWNTLKLLAQTQKLDIWYLFPIGALVRCLKKDGKIDPTWEPKITSSLGSEKWKTKVYKENPQISFFNDKSLIRNVPAEVLNFVKQELNTIFPGVCKEPKILKNSKNSMLFALFFLCSNPNATELALKIADYILKN